jgi:hypothetical protein
MAERPPGGAPSSRVKGTAGGGGGVKGPHSDSSTPSLQGQQPQKKKKKHTRNTQVRTGTHKEADAVLPFAARGLLGNTDEETDWQRKWEHLKH